MSQDPHRLPAGARPRRYRIEMRPDLNAATFEGTVEIDLAVAEPLTELVLNSADLEISDARLAESESLRVDFEPELERVRFTPETPIAPGDTTLHIAFSGTLNDKLMGFYRSTFKGTDDDGSEVEHTIAVTQFESTHARRAFPCFDEPELKATFQITLVVDESLFAVSNGAELSRTALGDGTDRVVFAETMSMSTYLVAMIVGPLVATEERIVEGSGGSIPLRIVHPPGSEHLCNFALEVAEAALHFYESYYEIPYPGGKLDLVAVPDFAFGAMENLGCVTFREVLLLIDPQDATQPELQRVADVINHELAHMWFGDLVTMKWWNGIWLNEAFATFMEILASDSFRPEWDVWTNFGLARTAAFDTDSLHSTRPIEYEVLSPADAEGMFDILTYEKGASVVRMLEQYLGAETFRRGISAYLKEHSYGVTETTDLWDALETASGEPVRRIMDSWIFRGGHPKVIVSTSPTGVRLSQERFTYSNTVEPENRWAVPLSIRYRIDGTGIDQFETRRVLLEDDLDLDLGGQPTMFQPNGSANGFFRSALDPALRTALASESSAPALERFMLVDDVCADFNSGHLSAEEVWTLLVTLSAAETDPAVWRRISAAARELHHLRGPAFADVDLALIDSITAQPLERIYDALVAVNAKSAPSQASLEEVRGVIFSLRGGPGGDPEIRGRAREIFVSDSIDPSLFSAAIEVIAYAPDRDEHAELERRWRQATTPQDELRYLTALVDSDDVDLLTHSLELSLTEVRTQNAPYLLRRAIAHRSLGAVAVDFVVSNWDRIIERFPSNSLPRMLEGIRSLTERDLAKRTAEFVTGIDLPSGQQQVDQHIERMWITVNAAERARRSAVP